LQVHSQILFICPLAHNIINGLAKPAFVIALCRLHAVIYIKENFKMRLEMLLTFPCLPPKLAEESK